MSNNQNTITDDEILERIIMQMEAGVLPWRRPWSTRTKVVIASVVYPSTMWPSNLRAPRVGFGMFNGLLLLSVAYDRKYRTNLWVTQEALDGLGATYDGNPVAIRRYTEDEFYQEAKPRLVYNIEQVEDFEATLGLSIVEREEATGDISYKDSEALRDQLVRYYALKIQERDNAAYSPSWDVVMMPPRKVFGEGHDGEAHYWATLWHEVVHWTGHATRLNRPRFDWWGDTKYAFEELIAEIGSAFLCAHLNIPLENLQHPSYLDSWCRALSEDKSESLWSASKHARDAKDYVFGTRKKGTKTSSTDTQDRSRSSSA